MKRLFKCFLLLLVLIIGNALTLTAQNNKQRIPREQLAETQAQYIADKVGMDDADAKRFAETYKAYQKEIWALGARSKLRSKAMTDTETEEAIKQRFERSQQILSIREKYYGIYSKFLTQKQIQRVYTLEKQLMQRLAQRQKGRHNRR